MLETWDCFPPSTLCLSSGWVQWGLASDARGVWGFAGMLWGQGHTCAGRTGLAPPGLPAEVHGRLALWHTALPCQAAGKAENICTQSYRIWGLNTAHSHLLIPQCPTASSACSAGGAGKPASILGEIKSCLDQRDSCGFLN